MKSIIKRICYLIIALSLVLSFSGCGGKKGIDLSPAQSEYIESITNMAVTSEVYSRYGLVPGMTIDETAVYDDSIDGFYHITFYTSGSYTVADDSGNLYSGTFKVKGYSEAHGSGWDSCDITEPRNGTKKLPEQSIVTEETLPETTVQTTVLVLQSETMIRLSKDYEKKGYSIMICDPASEFENAYGALECFRAFNDNAYYEVYLYDSNDAASNAEYMMFGEDSVRTASDGASTQIIEGTVLVIEHTR